jgi:hypothetical protein
MQDPIIRKIKIRHDFVDSLLSRKGLISDDNSKSSISSFRLDKKSILKSISKPFIDKS